MKILKKIKTSIIHPRYLAKNELNQLISLEANSLSGKMLDIGCGVKPYKELLKLVKTYIGMDMPSSIHEVNELDLYSSALALPFSDSSFDSLLCTEVIEHVPDPYFAIQEMYRVIRSGGILLLTVPFSEQLHEEPHDYYRFTIHGLKYLLISAKWKILRLYNRGGAWLEFGYRLSSLLYSSIGSRRDETGFLHPRPIIVFPVICLCIIIQLLFGFLDRIWKIKFSTIGYVVVAQK